MTKKSTKEEIQDLIDHHACLQDVLDDLVHDQASELASAVNNDGVSSQLEFLNNQRQMDDESILQHLRESLED